MKTQQHSFGMLLLAAGSSTRMGTPKQLLTYKGLSLLRRTAQEGLLVKPETMLVVLGAEEKRIKEEIKDLEVDWVLNEQYEEGMASSIRRGLQSILERNAVLQRVMIMVCDQPHVNAGHLASLLLASFRSSDVKIVASEYKNTKGVPALFDKSLFPELLQLNGDVGARFLMEKYKEETVGVPFPLGAVDVDTIEDYQELNEKLMDKRGKS